MAYPLAGLGGDHIVTTHSRFVARNSTDTPSGVSPVDPERSVEPSALYGVREELPADVAWSLVRSFSPRDVVRVATQRDSTGTITNQYGFDRSLSLMPPSTPYAMYLSADRERYDRIGFDLDAHGGNAVDDARKLSLWLDELRIPHLIAESGPSGGRHIWLPPLAAPASADLVRELAHLTKSLLPSLDTSPLTNPVTGCLRPPGSPHRFGGSSRPISALSALSATLQPAALLELRAMLIDLGAELPPPPVPTPARVITDGTRTHLPGDRLPLSPRIQQLLDTPLTIADDASRRLVEVLNAMAAANWRFHDVLPYAASSPAFEHARTIRQRGHRVARTAAGTSNVLAKNWDSAVAYVASHPFTAPARGQESASQPSYIDKLQRVTRAVQALQDRANTMPGLWGADQASRAARTRRGTSSRRAALDALCLFMIQAASTSIAADCRRIALTTGYGKTVAAEALLELSTPVIDDDPESAWIVRDGEPESGQAQRYRLSKRFSTEDHPANRTIALTPPPPSAPVVDPLAHRDRLIQELTRRLGAMNLDVFAAPKSFGRRVGLVYLHLTDPPVDAGTSCATLAHRTGLSIAQTQDHLEQLKRVGMAIELPTGWARGPANPRAVAIHLDVAGYLEDRALRYQYERERWNQWLEQVRWNCKTHTSGRRRPRRAGPTAVALFNTDTGRDPRPRYPQRPDGRADHPTALRLAAARSSAHTPTLPHTT